MVKTSRLLLSLCLFFPPAVLPFTASSNRKSSVIQSSGNSQLFAKRRRQRFNTKQDLVRLESRIRVKVNNSPNGTGLFLIVDANNVRGVDDFKLTNHDLIRSLASWRRFLGMKRESIVCVIDHGCRPNAFSYDGITLVFAGPNRTADDAIAHDCQWLSQGEGRHDVLVTTSDNELRRRCMASNIKRLNKAPVGNHLRGGAVEVFSSAQLSSSLKRHWEAVMANATAGIPVQPPDTSMDALISIEKDLRMHQITPNANKQRKQNSDESIESDNSPIRPLGKRAYIEKTWQRVLSAETTRHLLEKINKATTVSSEKGEEDRLMKTISEYHAMHNSFDGSLKDLCFDQRIRYDTNSHELLTRYINKSTQSEIMEIANLEHNSVLKKDVSNITPEKVQVDDSGETPITLMRRIVSEAGNKSQTQVVAQYMDEAPAHLRFRKSRDVRTLLASVATREKRPPLYSAQWYLHPEDKST
uniref:Uncharacterized protein n=1 Tax=Ditylum brightwellii TaxID=49249 RepID=A0A7S2A5X3_9STRA|mmetsp:Transcript_8656/g.12901  ORF Transcript_8656/g.12901 Transcript_8656/m.12901 type:complete len:471 (+) Transcript_8656:85-1497(+)